VGTFAAHPSGLYDLSGNVWEWCEEWFDPAKRDRHMLRGASWFTRKDAFLRSSYRWGAIRGDVDVGFRCVLEVARSTGKATRNLPSQNHLGMKFVPVPITGGPTDGKTVLFSVWETRVKDYSAFVNETKREWPKPNVSWNPDFKQSDDHPAVMVTWEDAVAFCTWLTGAERKKGKIGPQSLYRLPTDHEWSCAVAIGKDEDPAATPSRKNGKIVAYPWGEEFPPPEGAGNFSMVATMPVGVSPRPHWGFTI